MNWYEEKLQRKKKVAGIMACIFVGLFIASIMLPKSLKTETVYYDKSNPIKHVGFSYPSGDKPEGKPCRLQLLIEVAKKKHTVYVDCTYGQFFGEVK